MKHVTVEKLNENDNPKDFNGECLGDDGENQLWSFGGKFANRWEGDGDSCGFDWSGDAEALRGWFPNNDESEWINDLLE